MTDQETIGDKEEEEEGISEKNVSVEDITNDFEEIDNPLSVIIGVVLAPDGTIYLVEINGTRYWGSI